MPKWPLATALVATWVFAMPACAEPAKLWELSGFDTPESVLVDSKAGIAYVSNVAGEPTKKDGNGFISIITLDGKMKEKRWVTGLNAPKGLATVGGKLYVADIDRLVEIDTATGKISATYEAPGAVFLNDAAADTEGRIYVSDMQKNTIWRLDGGAFEPWLVSEELKSPNGLLVFGDRLIVAGWGTGGEGMNTETPGNLVEVKLSDKSIADLGDGTPVGNLDGIEPAGDDAFYVTDWVAGGLYLIDSTGKAGLLLDLNAGSADLGIIHADKTLLIPMMQDGKVAAYQSK